MSGRNGGRLAYQRQQLADSAMGFKAVPQCLSLVDAVPVVATLLGDGYVTGILHVAHNFLNGTFGDTDFPGHVAQAYRVITLEADKHVTVVAEKGPIAHHMSSCNETPDEPEHGLLW
jgi:hypothetical protein